MFLVSDGYRSIPAKLKKPIQPVVLGLINDLKKIMLGNECLFRDRLLPNCITKGSYFFQEQLFSLYNGDFIRSYIPDINFQNKYDFVFNDLITLTDITSCKGSWKNIENTLHKSIENYKSYFVNGYEPYYKDMPYLPRNMHTFIFYPYGATSYFYLSLVRKARKLNTIKKEKKVIEIRPTYIRKPKSQFIESVDNAFLISTAQILLLDSVTAKNKPLDVTQYNQIMVCFDSTYLKEEIKKLSYKEFLKTKYWGLIARKKKMDCGYRCQLCDSNINLNVHHKTYKHHGQEHLYLEDLIVLCQDCHSTFHHKLSKEKEANK